MPQRLIWVITGIIVGIASSAIFHSRLQSHDGMEVRVTNTIQSVTDMPVDRTTTFVEELAEVSEPSIDAVNAPEKVPVVVDSKMPPVYSEVIGPPRPKRFSAADRHAYFLLESRDEVWASSMESGIRNYLVDSGSDLSFQVEYVECRSRHCEIAGYVPDGHQDDSDKLIDGLSHQGWWLGGNSSASTGREIQGVERVVIIINRYGVSWNLE